MHANDFAAIVNEARQVIVLSQVQDADLLPRQHTPPPLPMPTPVMRLLWGRPTLRFIHTSDWHLGHTLKEQDRGPEHAAFLGWLTDRIRDEQPDALLIAGDVFDSANPPASALRAWYRFLVAAHGACPDMTVVAIAGNHDSGARLDAPRDLLGHFRVQVVGAAPRGATGDIDAAAMLVEVTNRAGQVLARVAAVPYLRPSDLPGGEDPEQWVEAIRSVYGAVFDAAPADGVPLLAMGHSYMVGGQVSDLSERKILGGNLHALPVDIFPDHVAYAALGHLHLAQRVGPRETVRYSGSPIPLALDERGYPHQICVVDVTPNEPTAIRKSAVPRTVAVPRVPVTGSLPLADVLATLGAMSADKAAWIEVCVRAESTEVNARAAIEDVMVGKRARVLAVSMEGGGSTPGLADLTESTSLAEFEPEEVFRRKWNATWPDEPLPDEMLALFHELLDAVAQESA